MTRSASEQISSPPSVRKVICARINLDFMWQEEFALKDFRTLMGVPNDKLLRMPDLLRFCVKVAQEEVNGMADFKVDIKPIRKGWQDTRQCYRLPGVMVAEERGRAEGSISGDQSLESRPTRALAPKD